MKAIGGFIAIYVAAILAAWAGIGYVIYKILTHYRIV